MAVPFERVPRKPRWIYSVSGKVETVAIRRKYIPEEYLTIDLLRRAASKVLQDSYRVTFSDGSVTDVEGALHELCHAILLCRLNLVTIRQGADPDGGPSLGTIIGRMSPLLRDVHEVETIELQMGLAYLLRVPLPPRSVLAHRGQLTTISRTAAAAMMYSAGNQMHIGSLAAMTAIAILEEAGRYYHYCEPDVSGKS